MKVGFTGTQIGMNARQQAELTEQLTLLRATEFHHGDCVGADEEAHHLVRARFPSIKIICHPPTNPLKRAGCTSDGYREPKEYLDRNRDIVDETDYLIAAPATRTEKRRSGTWYTVRYARKLNRDHKILRP